MDGMDATVSGELARQQQAKQAAVIRANVPGPALTQVEGWGVSTGGGNVVLNGWRRGCIDGNGAVSPLIASVVAPIMTQAVAEALHKALGEALASVAPEAAT